MLHVRVSKPSDLRKRDFVTMLMIEWMQVVCSQLADLILVVVALQLVLHVVHYVLGGQCQGVAWRVLHTNISLSGIRHMRLCSWVAVCVWLANV